MITEPLSGWRQATARATKTKVDGAREVAALRAGRYARCQQVLLVCDNLNTHTTAAFSEAVPAAQARASVRRIQFGHTPQHGSWLNVAEHELSALTRQGVAGRRCGELVRLQTEIAAWSRDVNDQQRGLDWQLQISDARRKLQSVDPKIRL